MVIEFFKLRPDLTQGIFVQPAKTKQVRDCFTFIGHTVDISGWIYHKERVLREILPKKILYLCMIAWLGIVE